VRWYDSNGVQVTNPSDVGAGTYKAYYYNNSSNCSSTPSASVTVSNCVTCYKPAATSGTQLNTPQGITSLGRAGASVKGDNWPMVRKGGWMALEAKTKGFVMNRLTTAQISAIPSKNLVEGMMIYNTNLDCIQVNIDGTASGWKCFNTQSCF
jgi:hypothetical protein